MKRLRGCLGVFLIFFFGVIVGAALTGGAIWKEIRDLVEGGPEVVVTKVSDKLSKELHLDDTQKKMLDHILLETRIALRGVRSETRPQVDEVLSSAEKKFRAVLNEHQQKKFDEIIGKLRENWEKEARPEAKPGESDPKIEATPSANP